MTSKTTINQFRWLVATLMLVAAMVMPSTTWAQSTYIDDFVGGRTDFRDESIYFVLTTRFYDGDKSNNAYCWDHSMAGNGMDAEWRGDFKGLIEKLDYIKALGFTAVWISPVAENGSGYDYHGYHPIDFSKEDIRLQSKANAMLGIAKDVTFQTLVDEAHKRGMKIILDIVLNSTCNFGEANLCQMFRKDYNAVFEGGIDASMIPITVNDTDEKGNPGKLAADYSSLLPGEQYLSRLTIMKNSDNQNHDSHNYWHHEGSMSFGSFLEKIGMIAGDCVDLNTENPAVYKYLREQYGRFIEMGVDGFRIECAKHISRLTFNKAFLPYFHELGEKYKSKRLNECPFFIYGDVVSRYSTVTNGESLPSSPYYYTWQSDAALLSQWNDDATFWDDKEILGNTDVTGMGNIGLAYTEYITAGSEADQPTSENAKLNGNEYHTPNVSLASGMNVIDFPMHWNFGTASGAFNIAKSGDRLYNDATYNVVYVDSHDYAPLYPSEQTRFSGGTVAWAENLDLMFTFRGIPCLYYGSEIEFKKDCVIDVGPDAPLKNTGRAYYGGYITGDVTATGFGSYSNATGNMAATLSKPLARHIARLSQIRQKIPALRKGQYSTEGCNGTIAFKRRYTSGDIDSYALVAISGTATFSGVLNGTYTEVITGQTVTVNDGTLTSPEIAKGNMRIYVLNGNGKIGEDGPYLFDATAASATELAYDGHQEDDCEEAPEDCRLKFSPTSDTFTTETLDITITPTNKVASAWYKIGEDGTKTDINIGEETIITIGEGIESGDIDIYYGCTSVYGLESNSKVTYHKTGNTTPGSDGITIYVKGEIAPNLYTWVSGESTKPTGDWPGAKMTKITTINGEQFWYYTITGYDSFNYVLSKGGNSYSVDLTADDDRYHGEGPLWKDITDEMTTAPADITIYVKGDEAPNIYAWVSGESGSTPLAGAWPGTKMHESTTINGEQFWYYTITGYDSFNYIINNGSSQTGNCTADGDRYHGEGTSWKDITDEITSAPTRLTLTVVGDETLLGAGWNLANTECDMTSQDGKLYTLTLLNRTLAAGNYNFKICKDHSWTTTYPAGDNAVVTIPADGTYNVTFCYKFGDSEPSAIVNPSNKNLTLVANSGSTDYYATFSDQQAAHEITAPTGKTLKVYDAKVANGKMTLTERSGNQVAKGEGVLIWSDSPTLSATTISDELTATTTTDLVATPATEQTLVAADGYTLYRLTYNSVENKTGLGFYLSLIKDENNNVDQSSVGKKLKAAPGKAYLKVSTQAATEPSAAKLARGFAFPGDDNETTGIECITVTDEGLHSNGNAEGIFDLQGRKVSKPTKGVYIKNGKKVVINL